MASTVDFQILRELQGRYGRTRAQTAITQASNGTVALIAAPASGVKIVIRRIIFSVNCTTGPMVATFQDGSGAIIAEVNVITGHEVNGLYDFRWDPIALSAAQAFNVVLSGTTYTGRLCTYYDTVDSTVVAGT